MASVRVRSFRCPVCGGPASVVERATLDSDSDQETAWDTRAVECEAGCDLSPTDVPVAG